MLLSSASTKVFDEWRDRICHARDSHQGDLLSPLLFLFVMEVLHTMICKADEWSLLSLIGV
jgi:hypothetical protein